MKTSWRTILAGPLVLAGALVSVPCGAQEIEAITRPSKDVYLSFVRPGLVAEVFVKDGEKVQAEQVLVRLDDEAERIQLEQIKAEAEDTTRMEAAEAKLDQTRVDLKKFQRAQEQGGATSLEVDHAKLDVLIADLSLKLSRLEHAQQQRKYEEAKAQLDRMALKSPIAGIVETVAAKEGEAVEEQARILRVVKIDPLWLDVPVPAAQAEALKVGRVADVRFGQGSGPVLQGKITYLASVIDAASDTRTVRVECPNSAGRPAGEHVHVGFPTTQTQPSTEAEPSDIQPLTPVQ